MSVCTKRWNCYVSWGLCPSPQRFCALVAMLAWVCFYINGRGKRDGWWCDWVRPVWVCGAARKNSSSSGSTRAGPWGRRATLALASTGGDHLPYCILRVLVRLHVAKMCCVKRLMFFHGFVYRFCSNIRPLDWRGHQAAALPASCAR